MIKFNGNNIYKWLKGTSLVNKVYKGEVSCYPDITNDTPPTPTHDYSVDYLTFRSLEDGTYFSFSSSSENQIQYSVDSGSTWSTLQSEATTPTISSGNTILWKASLTSGGLSGIGRYSSTGQFEAEGNIMSLLYGDNFSGQTDLTGNDGVFLNLFRNHSGLTSTENLVLPATTLPVSAYTAMFYNCMNLTTAPSILPSTNLSGASRCYEYMFQNCSGLTTAPALPATTLASYCYDGMFRECTSLTTAPALPATTLTDYCYQYMFRNCLSLTTAPELPATTLAHSCYQYMFSNCTSLTTAPELPSTTLISKCYQNMFASCSSLTTAPALPATTLAQYCYSNMFTGCTSLSAITCLATDISASNCTANWVRNVASAGTFTKAASMNDWTTGNRGIPSGWTVVDYSS